MELILETFMQIQVLIENSTEIQGENLMNKKILIKNILQIIMRLN